MNNIENKMVKALKDLKENHHVIGVKAEFEAEGTRIEEALRLKEVVTKAGLELTIKIGGCEAIKDIYDARAIGVANLVAPMIESAYALKKFILSVKNTFPADEREAVSFLVNIETIDGYRNFERMLEIPEAKELGGVVLGRVDMCGSLGMGSDDINADKVLEIAKDVFQKAKAKGLKCVIGGGIAKEALPFLRKLNELLDRYETRKVIFKCPEALSADAEKGILKAVGFELMWLKNKRDFYGMIYNEDKHRIDMLQSRYDKLIKEVGGIYE
jgi:4-hydroxy-2-oxoheptanedioate aldolase